MAVPAFIQSNFSTNRSCHRLPKSEPYNCDSWKLTRMNLAEIEVTTTFQVKAKYRVVVPSFRDPDMLVAKLRTEYPTLTNEPMAVIAQLAARKGERQHQGDVDPAFLNRQRTNRKITERLASSNSDSGCEYDRYQLQSPESCVSFRRRSF